MPFWILARAPSTASVAAIRFRHGVRRPSDDTRETDGRGRVVGAFDCPPPKRERVVLTLTARPSSTASVAAIRLRHGVRRPSTTTCFLTRFALAVCDGRSSQWRGRHGVSPVRHPARHQCCYNMLARRPATQADHEATRPTDCAETQSQRPNAWDDCPRPSPTSKLHLIRGMRSAAPSTHHPSMTLAQRKPSQPPIGARRAQPITTTQHHPTRPPWTCRGLV